MRHNSATDAVGRKQTSIYAGRELQVILQLQA